MVDSALLEMFHSMQADSFKPEDRDDPSQGRSSIFIVVFVCSKSHTTISDLAPDPKISHAPFAAKFDELVTISARGHVTTLK